MGYLVRKHIIDPQQNVIGYVFTERDAAEIAQEHPLSASSLALLDSEIIPSDQNWSASSRRIFFLYDGSSPLPVTLASAQPSIFVAQLSETVLDSEASIAAATSTLNATNIALGITSAFLGQINPILQHAIQPRACAMLVNVSIPPHPDTSILLSQKVPMQVIGTNVNTWATYAICAKLPMDVLVTDLHVVPRPGATPQKITPEMSNLSRLMSMLKKLTDAKIIENSIKTDASLSYKLLLYANSAIFPRRDQPIQSLKHAISLIGYSPLYRWLSVVFATAVKTQQSHFMIHMSLIRAHFAELLAPEGASEQERDDLFVVGMFSLLDKIFGLPMPDILKGLYLPPALADAIQFNSGPYGQILRMVSACDTAMQMTPVAASLNDPEFLSNFSEENVNRAHLAALSAAQHA